MSGSGKITSDDLISLARRARLNNQANLGDVLILIAHQLNGNYDIGESVEILGDLDALESAVTRAVRDHLEEAKESFIKANRFADKRGG